MKKTMTVLVSAVALALVLGGCASLAPPYERPAAPVPPAWPEGAAYAPASPVGEGVAADRAGRSQDDGDLDGAGRRGPTGHCGAGRVGGCRSVGLGTGDPGSRGGQTAQGQQRERGGGGDA